MRLPRGWWQAPCWYAAAVLHVVGYHEGRIRLPWAIGWLAAAAAWALAYTANAIEQRWYG